MLGIIRAVIKCSEHLNASKSVPLLLFFFFFLDAVCIGPQLNQGSCISLDVLKLVDLNYCGGNIKA